jgi:hypothetical protein
MLVRSGFVVNISLFCCLSKKPQTISVFMANDRMVCRSEMRFMNLVVPPELLSITLKWAGSALGDWRYVKYRSETMEVRCVRDSQ